MQLKVINSNSAGNCYILENEKEALLIECGVRIEKIKQALGYNIRKVVGCIVTHEHLDHCKSVKELLALGIDVWSGVGTLGMMGILDHHRSREAEAGVSFTCGGFRIKPFEVKHDAAQPYGYLIHHPECGTVLFLTDSYYCEYNFKGLNNVIIEANYCQKILDQRVIEGANPKFLRDRVITSHMSLATTKTTLETYDLSQVNNIVLIHLSDGNSDERRFKKEVEEATGKSVHVAAAGMTIPFNKKPF